MQWCEGDQGTTGYLSFGGQDPDYRSIKCWRFGDVAIFRTETPKGPEVHCLRNITIEDSGELHALDCDQSAVFYRLSLR